MDYGQALYELTQGKKVSCERWGKEGKIYVEKLSMSINEGFPFTIKSHSIDILVLTDKTRNTKVSFTPSVENQLSDKWYVVKGE